MTMESFMKRSILFYTLILSDVFISIFSDRTNCFPNWNKSFLLHWICVVTTADVQSDSVFISDLLLCYSATLRHDQSNRKCVPKKKKRKKTNRKCVQNRYLGF